MNESVTYKKYKTKLFSIKTLSTVSAIKTDIYTFGPNTAAMMVYDDFLTYKSGIYVRKSKNFLGGHAIKAIGWGVDSATNIHYWILANSWTANWG